MNVNEWIKNPKTIEKSKKNYAHFDCRTDISKVSEYIINCKNIQSHGFYPFIRYKMRAGKYNKIKGFQPKRRDICYAAHIDRCIFQLYGWQLNELYNKRIRQLGLENVPVAYRTDLKKNNIHCAKEAFDYIRKCSDCYVLIGDFTEFFDCLDHQYLKKQWCSLLEKKILPEDHYAVFKNITKYSWWELEDLLVLSGLENTLKGYKLLNKKRTVITKEQFHQNRNQIKKNVEGKGIPQGSSISAVLANIYMLEADKEYMIILAL